MKAATCGQRRNSCVTGQGMSKENACQASLQSTPMGQSCHQGKYRLISILFPSFSQTGIAMIWTGMEPALCGLHGAGHCKAHLQHSGTSREGKGTHVVHDRGLKRPNIPPASFYV